MKLINTLVPILFGLAGFGLFCINLYWRGWTLRNLTGMASAPVSGLFPLAPSYCDARIPVWAGDSLIPNPITPLGWADTNNFTFEIKFLYGISQDTVFTDMALEIPRGSGVFFRKLSHTASGILASDDGYFMNFTVDLSSATSEQKDYLNAESFSVSAKLISSCGVTQLNSDYRWPNWKPYNFTSGYVNSESDIIAQLADLSIEPTNWWVEQNRLNWTWDQKFAGRDNNDPSDLFVTGYMLGVGPESAQKFVCEYNADGTRNGRIFTHGDDTKCPGCGTAWCCQPDNQ